MKTDSKTEVKKVEMNPIQIGFMNVNVKGESPLLMNKFSDKSKGDMIEKQTTSGKTKTKELRNIKEEVKNAIYYTADGKAGVPVYAFKKALVEASSYMEGINQKDVKGSDFIVGDIGPLKFKKMVVNESIVRIGSFKVPYVRYRPSFHDWSCSLVVKYNASQIQPNQILNLFRLAGFHIGILDWRPQKNGQFGQFDIGEKHFSKEVKK